MSSRRWFRRTGARSQRLARCSIVTTLGVAEVNPELVAAMIGGIAIFVGIVAGLVQIVQYLQEARTTTAKEKSTPSSSSRSQRPWLSPDSAAYKFYSPAAGQVPRVIIVIPSRSRPPLEGRLQYANRPFKYDFAPDDVYTMATIMPYLVAVYGADYFTSYTPFVAPEEVDTLRFRPSTVIAIGSGVSNEVSKVYLANSRLVYRMIGYDIYRGAEALLVPKRRDDVLVDDYGLISRYISPTNQVIITLAGSHTFGQLAIAFALSDPNFYERVAERTTLDQCQVLLQADIQGRWISDYSIIDIAHCWRPESVKLRSERNLPGLNSRTSDST